MDGLQLATLVRQSQTIVNRIKIVLITAEDYDNDKNLFDEVYFKPLAPKQIRNIY